MKQTVTAQPNRIDNLVGQWDQRQQNSVASYGRSVLNDRNFLQAKRKVFGEILKQHPYKDLSFDEKIAYHILKGQMQQTNRRLFPNPLVRLVRNTAGLAGKLLMNVVKWAIGPENIRPYIPFNPQQQGRAVQTPVGQSADQGKLTEQPALQQGNKAAVKTKPEVQKRLVKSRVMEKPVNGQKMGRH